MRGSHAAAFLGVERRSQKSSKRPLSLEQRRAMMLLAPETVQCIAGPLEPGPDQHFTASLQDAGGGAQGLGMKLRVSHAGAMAEDVQHAFSRLDGRTGMGTEGVDDGVQFSVVQFGAARGCPCFGVVAGGPEDRLSGAVQSLFDVEPIEDLNGLRKQFRSGVPDPGGAIAQHHASWSLGETAARRFPQRAARRDRIVGGWCPKWRRSRWRTNKLSIPDPARAYPPHLVIRRSTL